MTDLGRQSRPRASFVQRARCFPESRSSFDLSARRERRIPYARTLWYVHAASSPHLRETRRRVRTICLPRHLAVYLNVSGFELQQHRVRGLEKERPIRPMSSTHELEDRRLAGSSERGSCCFFARARNFITHTRVCPAWRTVCDRGGGSIMTVSATVRTCAMGPLLFGTMVLHRSTVQAWRPIWQDSDRAYLEPVGIFQ